MDKTTLRAIMNMYENLATNPKIPEKDRLQCEERAEAVKEALEDLWLLEPCTIEDGKCPNCGFEPIHKTDNFCRECGQALIIEEEKEKI